MLYISSKANFFHPLWVVVDELAFGGGPLFPQTADPQVLVLHCHPLSFEPYQQKLGKYITESTNPANKNTEFQARDLHLQTHLEHTSSASLL